MELSTAQHAGGKPASSVSVPYVSIRISVAWQKRESKRNTYVGDIAIGGTGPAKNEWKRGKKVKVGAAARPWPLSLSLSRRPLTPPLGLSVPSDFSGLE